MNQSNLISTGQFVKRLPNLLLSLPSLIKGIRMATSTDLTKSVGIALCFEEAVLKNPDGPAVISEGRSISYRQMDSWANRIAHLLLSRGVEKGDSVAILLENRPELLVSVLACAKIGAISAMLNTAQKGKILAHSINIVAPKCIIAGEECHSAFDNIRDQCQLKDHFYFRDGDTLIDPGAPSNTPNQWQNLAELIQTQSSDNPGLSNNIKPEDPCFYIYTSGTTGLPKAVIFNHGRFMKLIANFGLVAMRLQSNDRLYVPLPFYHATALGVCWASAIPNGAAIIMARKFSASHFWDDIRKFSATSFGYVGEVCRYLLDQPKKLNDHDHNVRIIVGNGMRPAIWKMFKQRFNIQKVMEFYASSEGNVAFTNLFNFDETVGVSPLPFAIVKYDRESEQPIRNKKGRMIKVKKGESGLLIGEITAKTPFHGYTDPNKTKAVIFEGVFKKVDRWFNSGDIMLNMGFRHAQFVDRTGDTFRWKGENVSTTEVESLLEDVNDVTEAIVYGVEIPNTNGRAGMASLKLNGSVEDFCFTKLVAQIKETTPEYAIPVFLRINQDVTITGTFKHMKTPLKKMGFDLEKADSPIYVRLPKADKYVPLCAELQQKIEQGQIRY
ncbi:MAG: long-chain-acyl-CoA synthetase [Oleispira sp.]|nr:long-chain-acyl-CoA synthetase [Oleispira sp.]